MESVPFKHDTVDAFVKNAGLGFAIPYLHNGQMHDYDRISSFCSS